MTDKTTEQTSSNNNLEDRVLDLVHAQVGIETEVNFSSDLVHDLGMAGDDAGELMEAFVEEFNVDITNFVFLDYFPPEAGFRRFPILSHLKSITVEDLVKIARMKKWPES